MMRGSNRVNSRRIMKARKKKRMNAILTFIFVPNFLFWCLGTKDFFDLEQLMIVNLHFQKLLFITIVLHLCSFIIATGLFLHLKLQFQEGGNEGGRVATPTSFSIFDSYDMKSLWFKFGHDIFTAFKVARV